jgi:hypothetical protein
MVTEQRHGSPADSVNIASCRKKPLLRGVSAPEPLRLRRRVAIGDCFFGFQSESATLAIATAAHAIQHLEWSCGRDQRQPTSHGLWLTSSCLPSMHHANRFMPGRSSKPNATGESRARWHGLRAAAGVSSSEPAVLSQYYCLDSILGLRLSLHQRPTNS